MDAAGCKNKIQEGVWHKQILRFELTIDPHQNWFLRRLNKTAKYWKKRRANSWAACTLKNLTRKDFLLRNMFI